MFYTVGYSFSGCEVGLTLALYTHMSPEITLYAYGSCMGILILGSTWLLLFKAVSYRVYRVSASCGGIWL